MEKQISKSTKRRQGHRYFRNSHGLIETELDKMPRQWKQVVELTENGKGSNGKTLYRSRTRHLPVNS